MQTYSLKFVLVGDSGVGKSQLLRRFAKKDFSLDSKSTLNMEFSTRDIAFERCTIKAQIWDTVGQERFESLTKAYYRDAVGALLIYDVTNKDSFENAKNRWYSQLREYGHERMNIVLVGNKVDDESTDNQRQRQVSIAEATEFAKDNKMDFVETSALSNFNVESVFRRVILSVAPVIPDINSHLGLTGLPEGWIHLSQPQAKQIIADDMKMKKNTSQDINDKFSDDSLIDNDNKQKSYDSTADYFMNYWTGKMTNELPTQAAETNLLYITERRSDSIVSSSFYARGSMSLGGGGNDYDGLRIAGEEDVDVELKRGKCYCNIL
jgi:small GTP-binding protein